MEIQISKPGMTIALSKPTHGTPSEFLSLAYAVAAVAHEGQINKDGTPYITHPLRLLARWRDYDPLDIDGQIIALLHDTLEDTGITAEILRQLGFDTYIINGIQQLTRLPDPKEWNIDQREAAYRAHIEELIASDHQSAIRNKLFDLEDNMDITRLAEPLDEWSVRRTLKYHNAWLRLREVI